MSEKTYTLHVAGLTRELPICAINEHLDIAAFITVSYTHLDVYKRQAMGNCSQKFFNLPS